MIGCVGGVVRDLSVTEAADFPSGDQEYIVGEVLSISFNRASYYYFYVLFF